ncbi:hypothetical protein [Streptomyces sp. NPDC056480]|uniref:hypothetical protein n=1 Tax=Streptomyces sp. NPDC056480 TaxID=3345833 RepID=UPI0036783A46
MTGTKLSAAPRCADHARTLREHASDTVRSQSLHWAPDARSAECGEVVRVKASSVRSGYDPCPACRAEGYTAPPAVGHPMVLLPHRRTPGGQRPGPRARSGLDL